MQKYIDWHLEIAPGIAFLVDSSVPAVRMFAAKYATEIGAGNLAVYNSVNASALQEEWEAIRSNRCRLSHRFGVQSDGRER